MHQGCRLEVKRPSERKKRPNLGQQLRLGRLLRMESGWHGSGCGQGFRRLSERGWGSLVVLCATLCVGLVSVHSSSVSSLKC